MDLGSGNGKLVMQGAMEVPSLDLAVGIELDPERHSTGAANLEEIKNGEKNLVDYLSKVRLICSDIFDADVSAATHVYISSLCFSEAMMIGLGKKLQNEGLKINVVATLKPFPLTEVLGFAPRTLLLIKVEYVEMSWTRPFGCPVFFYRLQPSDGKQM